MKVAGLNNQNFQPAHKASNGKSSQGKGTSFESLLGSESRDHDNQSVGSESSRQESGNQSSQQNRNFERPQAPQKSVYTDSARSESSRAQSNINSANPAQHAPVNNEPTSPSQAQRDQNNSDESMDLNAESLPNGQGAAPTVGTPGLTSDRTVAPAVNPAYLNPMGQPAQVLSKDDAANTLTRRVVWNDFLRKMNDLGVSAEDVLKAFGTLTEKELAQPPEQSMDKIVAALGLQGPQAVQAKQAFGELIAKTKSKTLGEEFAATSKQLSVSLASQRDLQRKAALKNIEALDNNFFMNRKPVAPQKEQQELAIGPDGKPMAMPLAAEMPQEQFSGLENPAMISGNAFSSPKVPGGLPQAAEASTTQTATAARPEINGLVNQMQAQPQPQPQSEFADNKSIDQLIKNFNTHQMKAAPEMAAMAAPAAAPAIAGMQTVQAPAHASPEALGALNGIFAGGGKGRDGDEASTDGGDDQPGAQGLGQTMMPEQRLNANELKGDFGSSLAAKNAGQPQQMSVPDLVQQAHLMVKDGGGDMKVTLHPDGLGEVALRVSVVDGKVNVAMITESDEAKKLIERGIGDLKNGLSQNHLQVDSIKVDTATNLGKQLEQQYRDAQRQQTQAQWEQFRQDGGNQWRRSFFDTGVVNPYTTQGSTPRDTSTPVASARAQSRSGGSRRLDLVA